MTHRRRDNFRGNFGGAGLRLVVVTAVALLAGGWSAFTQVQRDGEGQEPRWEVLEGCRLMTNAVTDGDSFHVLYQGREYIFRLYFVDAPERDSTLRDRIKDQAAYFGIRAEDIPRAGQAAAQFTRNKLTGKNLTIITRWRSAMGRSSLARYYCMVLVGGENLAEELVANGHARIYGLRANWPDGLRSTTFINKLKNLELTAREKKLGVWNETAFPRTTGELTETTSSTNAVETVAASRTLIDVNLANYEELQTLPGIGPVLAERIMARRPFTNVEDLTRVPGIGPVILERLRPLVRADPAAATGREAN